MANRRTRRNKNKKGGNHDVFKDTPFELGSSESLTGGRKRKNKSGKKKKGGLDSSLAALGLLGTLLAIGSGKGKSRKQRRSKRSSKRSSNRRR